MCMWTPYFKLVSRHPRISHPNKKNKQKKNWQLKCDIRFFRGWLVLALQSYKGIVVHCMSGITGEKGILTFVFLFKYKGFIQTRSQSSAYCCCPSSLLDPWTGWVSLCFFILPESEKDFPQWGQSNGFSPVCDLWCILRWLDREKDFSQWGQSNGLSPVCDLWCLCKFADREKVFSHWEHLYAFSLLWVILCLCRLPDNEKDFWHCGQLYPFSPLWFIICLFRFSDNV